MGLFFVQPLCLRALVAKLFLLPQRHQDSKKHKAQLKNYTENLINNIEISILIRITDFMG